MPFLLKDETANANILYIDNNGQVGLIGSANSGQALTFAGVGVITSGAYFADALATAGASSSLTGTIVIPINSSASVGFNVPQTPTVTASIPATFTSTTQATFTNSNPSSSVSVTYAIW